jgi:hypothetical protein
VTAFACLELSLGLDREVGNRVFEPGRDMTEVLKCRVYSRDEGNEGVAAVHEVAIRRCRVGLRTLRAVS